VEFFLQIITLNPAKPLFSSPKPSWQGFSITYVKQHIMKHTIKNILSLVLFVGVTAFALTGCYESHYYNHYHHHTRSWYDRHHTPPPAGVDFNVDIHN
jgi:hypothetical protein